ncbi:CHAT domain-containing protein [Boletus coccyginus]|nr:CHAT domain-containing protein [Boletus coccyginus]
MNDFDRLVRLADNLCSRYEEQGRPSDLSLCIVHYQSALALARSSTALSDDTQSKLLSNLANALSMRFQRHGDIADLDHSVECHVTALDFRPPGHPGRANTLSNFATALLFRYGKLGLQQDIELAIKYFNTALSMLPLHGRLIPRMNYASALFSRFQHSGHVSDLSDAICQYHTVVDSSPAENKPTAYYNLANAILSRFKLENDPKDLELCIEYSSTALHGMNNDHPDCPLALSCLSTALIKRFESYGDTEDLEAAVKNFKSALELRPAGDSAQFMAFYDLADALVMRYKLQGYLSDIKLAIEHYRTALKLLSPDYRDEGIFLDNLGDALFLRFSRLGDLSDLEEAIQKHFFALEIHSENLPRRFTTLEALGTCLDVRFEQFHDPEDLHTAIDLYNEALIQTSQDNPHRVVILRRSASSLDTRFKLYGGIPDLDRSISYCREVIELLPPHHLDKATSYQALASSLLLRFEETGDESDLDEAYLCCSTSMNVQHTSDSLRATCDLLLARILKARLVPWEAMDIDSVFQHLRLAKDLCTLNHPLISDVYAELASTYYLRFLVEQRPSDLHEAFGHHELSSSVATGLSWTTIRASLQWVRDAEMYGHRSGVDVYRSALRLVNGYVLTMRSPEFRQCLARRYGANLAYNGASFALRFQEPLEAIEVLEGGRSVLWSQLARAQTCLDELRFTGEYGASLADDFERLSFQLEQVPRVSKSSKDIKPLLKEREAVAEQIRRVEGFKSFPQPTSFSELEKAALDGPVVILNASRHTCDALILQYNTPPTHVPLSRMTSKDVSQMATRFRELTGTLVTSENNEQALKFLLSDLWDLVVSPIVKHLLPHTSKGSRLWWCPTGPFASIPLHAAGPYRQGESTLSQLYVSSYTPTLQALIRARARTANEPPRSRRTSMVPNFLKSKKSKQSLISQTIPTIVAIGHTASDETCYELDLLRNRIPPSVPFRRIEGEDVTSEAVLAAFREPVWLHLACPASLVSALPCNSGFATKNGMLSLYDISKAHPQAQFAFLSGQCNRGDDTELEEIMHLAASVQYSGVRSVIGTLWPVGDEVMRGVAAAFYGEIILKAGGSMQYTNAARSLNEALKVAGKGGSLAQKIAFVHIGA